MEIPEQALQDLASPDGICFGCGPKNLYGHRIKSYWDNDSVHVVTMHMPDAHFTGWPFGFCQSGCWSFSKNHKQEVNNLNKLSYLDIMKIETIKLGKYQHYKNKKFYEVIGVARHSETREEMVIYKALYECEVFGNNHIWVRPKEMFLEQVDYNGCIIPRFKWIEA